jgi:S-adenosylmethionine decarboxylase
VDAQGCDPAALRDVARLQRLAADVVAALGLRTVGAPLWHAFPGAGGVTGLVLLAESHFACHTYPEFSAATFNLYCCRSRAEWPWREELAARLGAQDVSVRRIERGTGGTQPAREAR